MNYLAYYPSPLGRLTIVCNEDYLLGVYIENQKYYLGTIQGPINEESHPILELTKQWLDEYFAGNHPSSERLPIHPNGTPFQKVIWELLLEIPYGTTTTYKELGMLASKRLNKTSMSAQAVGGAVGHNPISIIIPCHRVVSMNNSLTGYAGGIENKMKLLEIEGIDPSKFKIPF